LITGKLKINKGMSNKLHSPNKLKFGNCKMEFGDKKMEFRNRKSKFGYWNGFYGQKINSK
jgi:hypothetical protein